MKIPLHWFFGFSALVIGSSIAFYPIYSENLRREISTLEKEIKSEKIEKQNQINELEEKISRLTDERINLKEKIVLLEKEKSEISSRLKNYLTEFPFSKYVPYPKVVGDIFLNDGLEKFLDKYPEQKKKRKPIFYTIDFESDTIFESATFYFDNKDKISHILYHLSYEKKFPKDFLKSKLTEIFGKSDFELTDDLDEENIQNYWITLSNNFNIRTDNRTYLLSRKDIYPNSLLNAIEDGRIKLNSQQCKAENFKEKNPTKN